ncbi:hypothetical protein [Vreelandella utahensis]|uniref:hypothetical protein n=1 Tax=Vreelandella halophila TaxID=86177 RepID=UPI000985987A|nr:hypothetical protein [Halomonas utahensis]
MTIFGVVTTAVYIFLVVALRWSSLPELQNIPLNEFGDFLAGIFGPLMLFWLILGYIQQQKELRQNTNALELQAEELKRSVEQHKELVATTREQLQADLKALEMEQIKELRAAHPSFSIISAGWRSRTGKEKKYEIEILNSGEAVTSVWFSTDPAIPQIDARKFPYFPRQQKQKLTWDNLTSGEAPDHVKLTVNCTDGNARPYCKNFDLRLDEHEKYHLEGVSEIG